MIEYEYTEGTYCAPIRVRLDSRFVGEIRPVLNGWRYFPKGSKDGGEVFNTVIDCQRSLETEQTRGD